MKLFPLVVFLVLQTQEPGDKTVWVEVPTQRNSSAPGKTLRSIEEHLPTKYGDKYQSNDLVTWGHETTHGINSDLSNKSHRAAFFFPPNSAAYIDSPRCTLTQVANQIPISLRGTRFNLYLIEQQKYFANQPLYIFDEWSAYVNGALVGLETPTKGGSSDVMLAPLEFSYYALALCLAAEKYDPQFAQTNTQFREFVAFEIRASAAIYERGMNTEGYRWNSKLQNNFRNSQDAAALRDLVVRWYGQGFYDKYLGGKK